MCARRLASAAPALLALLVLAGPPAPASAWTSAGRISTFTAHDLGGTESARGPVVAYDATGRATAIWAQTETVADSASWSIRRAELPPGTTDPANWVVDPIPVSGTGVTSVPETGNGDSRIALAVSPAGKAGAVWTMADASQSLQTAARGGDTGPFGGAATITDPNPSAPPGACGAAQTENYGPAVTPDAVFWIGKCGSFTARRVFARPFGSQFSLEAAPDVWDTDPATKVGPHVAYRNGTSQVIWTGTINAGANKGPTSRSMDAAGSFGPLKTYESNFQSFRTRIAILPGGTTIAAWRSSDNGGAAYVQIGDQPPVNVSGAQNVTGIELAAGGDGTAVVAWVAAGAWYANVMPPPGAPGAGVFGPADPITDTVGNPHHMRLAISDNGVGYAVWVRNDGTNDVLEAAILDPLDPNRSPGAPYQFQPVPDQIFDGLSNGPLYYYGALTPSLAVDPLGNAVVVAAIWVDANPYPDRYVIASMLNPTPRTAGSGGTTPPGGAPAGGDTPPVGGVAPAAGNPSGGGSPKDTKPPVISALSLSRSRFAAGHKEGQVVVHSHETSINGLPGPLRVGTNVHYTLSETATVTVVIRHTGCWVSYRGQHQTCKPHKLQGVVYRKKIKGKRGKNTFTFTGDDLLPRKRLIPGGWFELSLVAVDAAGNKSKKKIVNRMRVDAARP